MIGEAIFAAVIIAMEMADWKELEQIAAVKNVDTSSLLRGWILDRKTQTHMEQEA